MSISFPAMQRGVWTPSMCWNTGSPAALDGPVGGSYSGTPGGNWLKYGPFVWIEGDAQILTLGANFAATCNAQQFLLRGLPFTSAADAGAGYFLSFALSGMQNTTNVNFYQGGIAAGNNYVSMAKLVSGVETFLIGTDFAIGTYVKCSGVYITNQ